MKKGHARNRAALKSWRQGYSVAILALAVVLVSGLLIYAGGPARGMAHVREAAITNTADSWSRAADVAAVQAQWRAYFESRMKLQAGGNLSETDSAAIGKSVQKSLTPEMVVRLVAMQLGRTPNERKSRLESAKNATRLRGRWTGVSSYVYDVVDASGRNQLSVMMERRGIEWKVTGIEITGI